DVRPGDAVAGIDVEDDTVANVQMLDRRAAHMQFEHARLHQRQQTIEVFDRDDLPSLAVDHGAKTFLAEAGRGMLLKEALAARSIGTAQQRERPADEVRGHPVPDRTIIVRQILLGDAGIGPVDAVGMGEAHLRAALRPAAWRLARAWSRLRLRGSCHRLWRLRWGLRWGLDRRTCLGRYRHLPDHLPRRLVLAYALERRLAHDCVRGPAAQMRLDHHLGLDPADVAAAGLLARGLIEGRRAGLRRMPPLPQILRHRLPI